MALSQGQGKSDFSTLSNRDSFGFEFHLKSSPTQFQKVKRQKMHSFPLTEHVFQIREKSPLPLFLEADHSDPIANHSICFFQMFFDRKVKSCVLAHRL